MSKSKSWLTAEEESYLKQFDSRNRSIRDNVRLVAQRHSSGLYVCGSAGTSKTYTVTSILEEEEASYEVVAGHITGVGLFRTFQKNPHSTIVLDDVTAIFKNEVGKQILLSALGKGKNGERWVGYHKASMQERCLFFGGVIAISNLMLGCDPVSIALQSRVNAIEYIPEQEEIRAFIKHIAESKGFENMTIEESKELASFVITISLEEGKALDLRSITKSAEVYVASKSGTLESTWQDLVRNNLKNGGCLNGQKPKLSQEEAKAIKQAIVLKIHDAGLKNSWNKLRMIEEWTKQTGFSDRTFHRIWSDLVTAGRIKAPKLSLEEQLATFKIIDEEDETDDE